jgi:hypothetical protein
MYSLWFKQCYVSDILSGVKTSTYRLKRPRFVTNDVVTASVGPRLPFIHLRINRIDELTFHELAQETQNAISAMYNVDSIETVFHIYFTPVNSK